MNKKCNCDGKCGDQCRCKLGEGKGCPSHEGKKPAKE
jgi:hypothetical protein